MRVQAKRQENTRTRAWVQRLRGDLQLEPMRGGSPNKINIQRGRPMQRKGTRGQGGARLLRSKNLKARRARNVFVATQRYKGLEPLVLQGNAEVEHYAPSVVAGVPACFRHRKSGDYPLHRPPRGPPGPVADLVGLSFNSKLFLAPSSVTVAVRPEASSSRNCSANG